MDNIVIILAIIIFLLLVSLLYCLFFHLPSKQKEKDNELSQKISQDLKNNEELVKSLLENFKGELENQKEKNNALTEKIILSLDKNESLIKLRLENLSAEMKNNIAQPLEKINSILLHPYQRGKLGNSQLDQLLSLYLPKDQKVYQIEFTLKKKRTNGDGLRVDAIIFGVDGKNNIAIDSKFPLENYLLSADSNLTKEQREEFEKKFKNDVKNHIKKVAEYISELDSTKHAIMFVPSEVIFAKINEHNFYDIIELALEKKVTICSPILLVVIIDQILWANKTWEQYKNVDRITSELDKFWKDLDRFKERWEKIIKSANDHQKALNELDITTNKLINHGTKIKKGENILPKGKAKLTAAFKEEMQEKEL